MGELDQLLENALDAISDITGSGHAYLELRDSVGRGHEWSRSRGLDREGVERARDVISRGIVAEAIATGKTVATNSALLDARFESRDSVRAARIEAVICSPVGSGPILGALYIQGAPGGGPFSEEDRELAEMFTNGLAPFADRLLVRHRFLKIQDATLDLRSRFDLSGVVGRSETLARALEPAMLAAPLDVTVLLTGPSGSGKSQLARAIHRNSRRAQSTFVDLNCAAIQSTLLESELFGARAGSHSEAKRDIPGKVSAAEGGTLFLDEIGEIPIDAQGKLLQLLQDRTYFPLGATKPSRADVRIVAATNADLERQVEEGQFREDLFYRINVMRVDLPPLAERLEDLAEIANELLARAGREHGLPSLSLSNSAIFAIESAEWPGNVRELSNAIQRAAIVATAAGSTEVGATHLFPSRPHEADEPRTFQESTRRFQRDLVASTLQETDWNVKEAATRLDIARSYLYELIKSHGLERNRSD